MIAFELVLLAFLKIKLNNDLRSEVFMLLSKLKKIVLLVSVYTISSSVYSNETHAFTGSIPAGFEDYVKTKKAIITIQLYGNELKLTSEYSFRNIKTALNELDVEELEAFLYYNGVNGNLAKEIVNALSEGVTSSYRCQGLIEKCVLNPDTFDFVFDEQRLKLRIMVNEKFITKNNSALYFDIDKHKRYSLVNHTDLYVQTAGVGDTTLHWDNNSLVALNYGHLDIKSTLTADEETELTLHNYNYVLDRPGFSIELGYDELFNVENATTGLLNGRYGHAYAISAFNNDRLAKRTGQNKESMSVFVQEPTQLEIFKGEKLIYRSQLAQGVNEISYATFERGTYNVKLVFRVAGRIVKEESRTVFNVPYFDISVGEYDWYTKFGALEAFDSNYYAMLSSGISYRPYPNISLGGGFDNVNGRSYGSALAEWLLSEKQRISLLLNSGFNDDFYGNIQWNISLLNVSYESLSSKTDEFSSLYGEQDREQLGVSLPFRYHGFHNLNLTHFKSKEENNPTISTNSISLNSSYKLGVLGIGSTLQYEFETDDREDNLFFGVNINIPLSKEVTGYTSFNAGGHSKSELRSAIQYRHELNKNASFDGDIASSNGHEDREQLFSGQFGVAYSNDYFNSNSRLYVDSGSNTSASFNFQSSQLLDRNGLTLSKERADSYAIINNKTRTFENNREQGYYGDLEVMNDSNGSFSVSKLDNENKIVALRTYNEYELNLRSDSSEFISLDDSKVNFFAKPGSFISVENRLEKIDRYLVSFLNKDGDEVNDIECRGDGCYELEEVTEGVFKVSTFSGYNYALFNGQDYCLIKQVESSDSTVNMGRSVCLDRETLTRILEADKELYFLGLNDNNELDELTQKVVKLGKVNILFSRKNKNNNFRKINLEMVNLLGAESTTVTSKVN